jgi:endonuclease YncB( thermonuclease family)
MTLLPALLVAASLVRVIDGDTVVIDGTHVRIANIDAPELGHARCDAEKRLALVAKRRLEALLAGGGIAVHVGDPQDGRTRDRHGRTLATVSAGGRDVGEVLVAEGLARPWDGRRHPWCGTPE